MIIIIKILSTTAQNVPITVLDLIWNITIEAMSGKKSYPKSKFYEKLHKELNKRKTNFYTIFIEFNNFIL